MKKPHETLYFGKILEGKNILDGKYFIYYSIENFKGNIKPIFEEGISLDYLMGYLKGACFAKTVNHFELINEIPESLKGNLKGVSLSNLEMDFLKENSYLKKSLSKYLKKSFE